MKTMKSLAVTKDLKLEVVEVPYPKLWDDCVITKTLSCGVCNGTDSKIVHGEFKGVDTYPVLLGHEAMGEVIEVGKNVKQWKTGDIVTLPFLEMDPDGTYQGTEYRSAWSAYSEYTVARDWMAMAELGNGPGTPGFVGMEYVYTQKVLPKDIDPVYGAMVCVLREVLAASRHFGVTFNQDIVIFGLGSVGLTFVKMAKLLGARNVIAVGNKELQREEALRVNADYYINMREEDVVEEVRKILPDGADIVIDAVGVNEITNTSMSLIKDAGKIGVYGISSQLGMDLTWAKAPYNWVLDFFQFPQKAEEAAAHDQVVSWIRMGLLDLKDFVSHIVPFENILDAFDMVEKRDPKRKKIVISY
jgi:threonine dehydrogenase-like Zn-dependent dehydrogenase